jgi:Transposase DDE domain/Transposase domain (DUF772)
MSLGEAPKHDDLFRSSTTYCDGRLSETSIYRLLHERGPALFPDAAFADLFAEVGRNSVAPQIVATVMVLQRVEGLSDREAVDRFAFDVRWKYAAGVDLDYPSFVHTVLVNTRARLRASERPDRIFEAVLAMAKEAGLVGRKRVLDSTALYDAVATQDTVTMIRSAIRALLRTADTADQTLAAELRAVLKRDDTYEAPGKPACDWDDKPAREALVDALAWDAFAVLTALDGREVSAPVKQAAELVATVVGQDLEARDDGLIVIARRVAPDRVISVVDPEARHGHKTAARGFDGYKGHVAIDPDSEIITAVDVTAGNVGDGSVAKVLLADVLPSTEKDEVQDTAPVQVEEPVQDTAPAQVEEPVEVFGDASYGTADVVETLEQAGIEPNVKVQPPSAREGMYSQDAFTIDVTANTVCCPAGQLVPLRRSKDGAGHASFGASCNDCSQKTNCTTSKDGRSVNVHVKHEVLDRARKRQRDPAWRRKYRATRPKVERKLAHMMRRKHGGRRARVRGTVRVRQDFAMLAAAVNLVRLATLAAASE